MKCNLCHRNFRLTAYNTGSTCSTCLDIAEPTSLESEELDELKLIRNNGRVLPVFDTEGSDYNNDDYGHGY